jgi:hypothetical protein
MRVFTAAILDAHFFLSHLIVGLLKCDAGTFPTQKSLIEVSGKDHADFINNISLLIDSDNYWDSFCLKYFANAFRIASTNED